MLRSKSSYKSMHLLRYAFLFVKFCVVLSSLLFIAACYSANDTNKVEKISEFDKIFDYVKKHGTAASDVDGNHYYLVWNDTSNSYSLTSKLLVYETKLIKIIETSIAIDPKELWFGAFQEYELRFTFGNYGTFDGKAKEKTTLGTFYVSAASVHATSKYADWDIKSHTFPSYNRMASTETLLERITKESLNNLETRLLNLGFKLE